MSITEFLLARIAEDEEEAARMGCTEYYDGGWSIEHEIHIRRECAAKRAIIGMHRKSPSPFDEGLCAMCAEAGANGQAYPCDTIKVLAAIYSDHPDYRQEWAA